jgi:hypothetical protein
LLALDNVGNGANQLNSQPRIFKFDRPLQVDFTRSFIQFGQAANLSVTGRSLPITMFYCSAEWALLLEKVQQAEFAKAVFQSNSRELAGIIKNLPDCPV